ncbi:MAG TPA: radical SAM protein [Polyangiaceae bacterium]|nr:radical SAM protein [Polyangiaceae bacterium]
MAERLVVVWRVTTRCNLSCGFCAYDRSLPFARHDADEASALRFGESLATAANHRAGGVHVSLLGGEPLLWEPLPRVARHFAALGLSLGLTSNGVGLRSAALRQLVLDCFDELTLSVDGVGATHDALRGWPGGYERLLATIAELGRGKLKLRVNVVLMRENIEQFAELCRELAKVGVAEVTFNRLGGRDRPEFFRAERLAPEQLEQLARQLPALRRELATLGLSLRGGSSYLERLVSLERGEPVAVASCEPGERFLFVDEHGNVAPCSHTLGSYGEPLPGALAELPLRFLVRQRASRAAVCDDCPSTQVFEKFKGA